jgi:hypothetical protein
MDEYHFHLLSVCSLAKLNQCRGTIAMPGTAELEKQACIHPRPKIVRLVVPREKEETEGLFYPCNCYTPP